MKTSDHTEATVQTRELTTVQEILQGMAHGTHESGNLFNFHGFPGMGKTALARTLVTHCQANSIPVAILDMDPASNPEAGNYGDPDRIVKIIQKQLSGNSKPEVSDALDTAGFISMIRNLANPTIVLIFDAMERAPKGIGLEAHILNPLCQEKNCLILWLTRFAWEWEWPRVRLRAICRQMGSWNQSMTLQQVQGLDPDLAARAAEIHRLTGGYPLANQKLAEHLLQHPNTSDSELLNWLVREVIDPITLDHVPDAWKRACRILSLSRQFDISMFENLVSGFGNVHFDPAPSMTLLSDFQEKSLIFFDETRKGYALSPILSHILRPYMLAHEKETAMDVLETLVREYTRRFSLVNETFRMVYIREWLWCRAALFRLKQNGEKHFHEAVVGELKTIFQQFYSDKTGPDAILPWNQIMGNIRKDQSDYEWFLGSRGWQDLTRFLDTLKPRPAQ